MTEQLELTARPLAGPAVSPTDPRIDQLLAYLKGRGWVKRGEIAAAFGWDDRLMREIKSQTGGLVISSSGKIGIGYKLTLESTPEEIAHALSERRSRIKELMQEVIDIEKLYHEFG